MDPLSDIEFHAALDRSSNHDPDPVFDPADNPNADSFKSAELGKVGDELHDAVVASIVQQETYLRETLSTPFRNMTRWWRLYLSQKDDRRKENEKWRANVVVPYAYSGVRTKVAAISDLINSADPIIQPEATSLLREQDANGVSRTLDYTLRKNKWELALDKGLTDSGVQGIWMPKLVHARRSARVFIIPNEHDEREWMKAVQEAKLVSAAPMPDTTDPATFEAWRQMVMTANPKLKIPEMPVERWEEIVDYDGPTIVHDPIFQYRYDPFVDDIQLQDLIIHRVVKTKQWLMAHTGDDPSKPYDPAQVRSALGKYNGDRFSEWQNEVASMMGLSGQSGDPRYSDAVELWECWRKDAQHPYITILNRAAIISKPDSKGNHSNPFWHGQYPFFPVRNVAIVGHTHGISEIAPNEPLYLEMNSLRDLRLDAVTLRVLPIFLRLADAGLPELSRMLQPGMIIPTNRPDGIKPLLEGGMEGVMSAFRELDAIKADIDETNSTPPSLRGGASTVGRVSATESERRFSQAMVRQKQQVLTVENDLQPFVRQALFLWYQFADSGKRIRVGGADPFVTLKRSMFGEALDMDYRFRGASKALNRDMGVQQLGDFFKLFASYMVPTEIRSLMKRVYETIGQRGVEEIVSDAGTQQVVAAAQAQQQAAQAQAQGGSAPGQGGPPPAQLQGAEAEQFLAAAGGQPPNAPQAAPAPPGAPQ